MCFGQDGCGRLAEHVHCDGHGWFVSPILTAQPIRAVAHTTRQKKHLKLYTEQSQGRVSTPKKKAAAGRTSAKTREKGGLAERLEAALRAGAEAVGCEIAALYVLDEETTELRLQSSCGMPVEQFSSPVRPLQGALADLEALLGHAVVLNDERLLAVWNAPEDFPTAVCIPVSSPTTLLGTLWVFSRQRRDFNDRETNVLEVVAGRLAADLERESLQEAAAEAVAMQRQMAAAERLQRNELPSVAPMLDGWDVAGATVQAEQVGGAFHDWFSLPKGLLAMAVGRATEQGIAGAWTATTAKTALRCHARYQRQSESVLPQTNLTLWTGAAGDRHASLMSVILETATGRIHCASAGNPSIVLVRDDGWESFSRTSTMLGESPDAQFEQYICQLQPGETLALFTDSFREAIDTQGRAWGEADIADIIQTQCDLSASELVGAIQTAFEARTAGRAGDRSILVVKRRRTTHKS